MQTTTDLAGLDFQLPQVAPPPSPETVRRHLLSPLADDDYLLVIDNSSLEKFTTCPLSAYYYLVQEREARARNAALGFGGAVHAGLEAYYLGADHATVAQVIADFWARQTPPDDEYRTMANAIEVLRHYRERATLPDYQDETLKDANGEPLLEIPFELPLGEVLVDADITLPQWGESRHVRTVFIAWSGRIDRIAHCHGANRVMDHKTTSIGGDNFIQDFQLASQTLGYVWAANQLFPEHAPRGFCLNAIHLKRPAKGVGIAERGPRGGDPALQFFRAYFDYTPERLAAWHRNTLAIVSDFLHCLTRDYFPAHTKWCFGKYGRCTYHDVCTLDDPQVAHNLLHSDAFQPVTWNPVSPR